MRRLSLNARLAQEAEDSTELQVVLFRIDHPDLPAPIRLSTDNTERLASEPDVIYGTRSGWAGADPVSEPYLWVIASALVPSDLEDTPAAGQIVLEALDREMVRLVRSFTSRATIAMAVVLAASPDLVEAEFTDMQILSADIDAGEIKLSFSRDEIENEPFPAGRMSRGRFPGLHL